MNFFSLLDWLLVLLLPPCELNSVPKESPAVQIQRFRPLSLLWWCFYSNTLNNKITAQLTTLQVWNTAGDLRTAQDGSPDFIYQRNRSRWSENISSHPSGVKDMIYVPIFTKEMTLKKSVMLSGFIQQLYFPSEKIFLHNYAGTKRGKINKSNWKWPPRRRAKQTLWGIFFFSITPTGLT